MKFVRLHHSGKEIIVIPNHKVLRKGMLYGLLKQISLRVEKLRELL